MGLDYAWAGGSINVTYNDPEADTSVISVEKFKFRLDRERICDLSPAGA